MVELYCRLRVKLRPHMWVNCGS